MSHIIKNQFATFYGEILEVSYFKLSYIKKLKIRNMIKYELFR